MSNPCTQEVVATTGNTQSLTFAGCSVVNDFQASAYGLNSFHTLVEIINSDGESINSTIKLDFAVPSAVVTSFYRGGTAPIVITGQPPQVRITNITNTAFDIEITNNSNVFIFYEVRYNASRVSVTLGSCLKRTLGGSFQSPGPNVFPNIFASIEATPDKQEICILDFTVETVQNEQSHLRVTDRTQARTFRQYCVPFTTVICAPDCTLQTKLDALGVSNDFVQYMVLCYVLSALLGKAPFNHFNVQLLRQRYDQDFLRTLAQSEYKVFLPTLRAYPEFVTYFKCQK